MESRIAIDPNVMHQSIDGEAVLLHLESGIYYGLDAVGTRVWELLNTEIDFEQLLEKIQQEFDVDPEQLEEDLKSFLQELKNLKIVKVE